jgi:hypothetical protein
VAQLREQLERFEPGLLPEMVSGEASEPPKVLVLDESHVGLAVLNSLKEEMKQLHTVLWADENIPVEFGYQSLRWACAAF